MRVLVTGGAGFLGSHLCDRLVADGHDVVCYDTLTTGSIANIQHLFASEHFRFTRYDVTNYVGLEGPLDWVMHLASPASPVDYLAQPIHTLKLGAQGTMNCLGLARAKQAGFFLASTSEVYGDPQVHPQVETYWGNVNPVGPRSVYDEAKRYAEAVTFAYHRVWGIPVRVVRIFNTYGPRMRQADGRAVPNFVSQVLAGQPLTVYGDGSQTRSLCYVSDLIEGFLALIGQDRETGPVNIGNPEEVTMLELAERIRALAGGTSGIVHAPLPADDPTRRRPDISLAQSALGWSPTVPLDQGLATTLAWCRQHWVAGV